MQSSKVLVRHLSGNPTHRDLATNAHTFLDSDYENRLGLPVSGDLPGSSIFQTNQSAIRMAPTAASTAPMYPRNRSPRKSNNTNMKMNINERYEAHKKDLRQLGAPIVCRHFGHGNDAGRGRLGPVVISIHRKELLQIGHLGSSGRNSIAMGQTIHSSISTTKIGHAISGAGNPKAIPTYQPLI
jgi:hypothetical protein